MILIKSDEQINLIRQAGKICANTLSLLSSFVQVGKTGFEADKLANTFIRDNGGIPATIGYRGYNFTTCISVNSGCVHCEPNNKPFKEGDVIKLDLVVDYKGFKADSAVTILIPPVTERDQKLTQIGKEALWQGISQAKSGNYVGDITQAVFGTLKGLNDVSMVSEFVGHAIGRNIHEAPQIPNTPQKSKGPMLVPGMTICIEPILVGSKDPSIFYQENSWPTWALSGANVVHNEHTLLIRENKQFPEILTLRSDEIISVL